MKKKFKTIYAISEVTREELIAFKKALSSNKTIISPKNIFVTNIFDDGRIETNYIRPKKWWQFWK